MEMEKSYVKVTHQNNLFSSGTTVLSLLSQKFNIPGNAQGSCAMPIQYSPHIIFAFLARCNSIKSARKAKLEHLSIV